MSLVLGVSVGLLVVAAIPLGVAVVVLFVQLSAAAFTRRRLTSRGSPFDSIDAPPRPGLVVLVPAHNEALGLASTLLNLRLQLLPGDRMLVVADNCDDETAAIARAAGASVVERFHDSLRGKGFALACGVDSLRADPPGLVVILDADCQLGLGAISALAACVQRTDRPAQALYLMLAPPGAGLARRLAQFAWRVRNDARPSGWMKLGLPCQLMGTGMAFSWNMLETASLANASIVEDMKLGIELASRGQPPVFCPEALVTSEFPDSIAASRVQRTRWEHGHLAMIIREIPSMVWIALIRCDIRLLGMALDLLVPPLAFLATLLVAFWVAGLILMILGVPLPFAVFSGELLVFVAAALVGWAAKGRELVRFSELLAIPWYIASKLPIYFFFLIRRQTRWVRTDRDKT